MNKLEVAREALKVYEISSARLALLKNVYNTTYRVIARNGEQYVLRISHPRRAVPDIVRSELLWLAALRDDLCTHVPQPVMNRVMQYVTILPDSENHRTHLCALFRWTTGRFLSRSLSPSHLLRVGELMAHLHDHATHWNLPAGFIRPCVESLNPLEQEQGDAFDRAIAASAAEAVASVSTREHGALVAAVIRKVWSVLQRLGDGPADFGLIHADVHQWNYLFHGGQVGVIDFDDCGFGHWLYDLAVTLYCLSDRPDFAALRSAFLTGYRQSRPLSSEQERGLESFMALRRLQDLLWVIGERHKPAFRDRWQTLTMDSLRRLRDFIRP